MRNIKELIRQEIDKRYAEYRKKMKTDDFTYYEGMADALDLFEQFLDTLPDEPVTDCHDLEEEYQEFCKDYPFPWSSQYLNREYIDELCLSVARHFAEWQKRKMMDEAYEEEVQEVYRDDDGIHCCVSVGTDYKPGTIVYVITIPKEDAE